MTAQVQIPAPPDCLQEFTGEIPDLELPARAEAIAEKVAGSYLYSSRAVMEYYNVDFDASYDIIEDWEYAHEYDLSEEEHNAFADKISRWIGKLAELKLPVVIVELVTPDFYALRILLLEKQ